MKETIVGYFGMYKVNPLIRSDGYAYQFKSFNENNDYCMATLNGKYEQKNWIVVQ